MKGKCCLKENTILHTIKLFLINPWKGGRLESTWRKKIAYLVAYSFVVIVKTHTFCFNARKSFIITHLKITITGEHTINAGKYFMSCFISRFHLLNNGFMTKCWTCNRALITSNCRMYLTKIQISIFDTNTNLVP